MKKIFYVIGYNGGGGGIGAIYFQTLAFIIYALNKGYIPIVDMQHYYNQFLPTGQMFYLHFDFQFVLSSFLY